MFINAYKRALQVILKKPFMLWGLSLLLGLLTIVANMVTVSVPFLSLAIGYLFACGGAKLYMDGLEGKKVNSKQLFYAFNRNCVKTAGAMAWRDLWQLIWGFVPVMGVIKSYAYAFVPYIVVNNPEISAFDALKVSMKLTDGKKGHMFLADLLFSVAPSVTFSILGVFARIPVLGSVFSLTMFALAVALLLFGSIFSGLYKASFFNQEEVAAAYQAVLAEQADCVAAE